AASSTRNEHPAADSPSRVLLAIFRHPNRTPRVRHSYAFFFDSENCSRGLSSVSRFPHLASRTSSLPFIVIPLALPALTKEGRREGNPVCPDTGRVARSWRMVVRVLLLPVADHWSLTTALPLTRTSAPLSDRPSSPASRECSTPPARSARAAPKRR